MKHTITVVFSSEEEKQVFIKILNRIKDDGALTPLDLGNLTKAIGSMDRIDELE